MPNFDRLRSQLQTPTATGSEIDLPHGDLRGESDGVPRRGAMRQDGLAATAGHL